MPASFGVHMARLQCGNLFERDLVVAIHGNILLEFAEVLHQVIGEGIVVVDHEQHKLNISSLNQVFMCIQYRYIGAIHTAIFTLWNAGTGENIRVSERTLWTRLDYRHRVGGTLEIGRSSLIAMRISVTQSVSLLALMPN